MPEDNRIEIRKGVDAGENIVPRGAEARAGGELVARGVRLDDAAIALAASAGKSKLHVFSRPRVAILTTGDEIVPIADVPGPTQIRNSNSYSLAAQIEQAGGVPVLLPIAPDEPEALRRLIDEGLHSDLLLLTGGVSMGRYDLVEQVLSEMHAEFFFTGAKIQPGRPVVFGKCSRRVKKDECKYFFGLPGNPVSTMVTFELFARPILESLSGMSPRKLLFVSWETQIRHPGEIRFEAFSSGNPYWRVREFRGRDREMAGIGRYSRYRSRQLLRCDSCRTGDHDCRRRVRFAIMLR